MRPKLTIGMATHSDFNGVYFTVQALRLSHAEALTDVEFVIVDNHPAGEDGKLLQGYVRSIARQCRIRYVPAPEVVGTAAPRDRVFLEAQGGAVLVCDCHVLFAPGAIRRLIDYYDANPGTRDLLSGPMLFDNLDLRGAATHFTDVWRSEMWGVWGAAWRGPDGSLWGVEQSTDGRALPMGLWDQTPTNPEKVPGWPLQCPWAGHEAVLEAAGWRPAAAGDEPFEIPAMGLGAFSCRKDAWPGFSPKFRAFGGEEWYIHTKVRQGMARCLCLPFLKWNHRFGRPGGVRYTLDAYQKARNYVLGLTELGVSLHRVKGEFLPRLGGPLWQRLTSNPADPPESPVDQAAAADCPTGCGQSPLPADLNLDQLYERARTVVSDIFAHVPKLRELAAQADRVVEFGHRRSVSTVALLAGQPGQLTSYDVADGRPLAAALDKLKGKTELRVLQGDSLQVEPEECQLLFIDTRHTAGRLSAELARHAPLVTGRICLHDTQVYGEKGEDGGPGLLPALRGFLKENTSWSVIYHTQDNHGFTVISNLPADKPDLPSTGRQAWNFGKALLRMAGAKIKGHELLVDEATAAARLDVCALCPQRNGDNCSVCGCFLVERPDGGPGKTLLRTEACPVGKWHDEAAKGGAA